MDDGITNKGEQGKKLRAKPNFIGRVLDNILNMGIYNERYR